MLVFFTCPRIGCRFFVAKRRIAAVVAGSIIAIVLHHAVLAFHSGNVHVVVGVEPLASQSLRAQVVGLPLPRPQGLAGGPVRDGDAEPVGGVAGAVDAEVAALLSGGWWISSASSA